MKKSELATIVSVKTGNTKILTERIIDQFIEEIQSALLAGEKVMLKGLANFEVAVRPARQGRNPKTNEIMTFPAVKTIKCRVSQALKDELNGKEAT